MQLGDDAKLLIEVAEDYAALVGNVLGLTQVKHQTAGSVTLRSDGVRKSLTGLLTLQDANPHLTVRLAYLTTAEPGVEAGAALPDDEGGIAYWRRVARGANVEPLRDLLLVTQQDPRILNFVREADPATLRARLIEPVSWLTGSDALPHSERALQARLRALALERSGFAEDGARAYPFLIQRVLETAISEDRVLTRDHFEDEWARATTMPVSITFIRQASAAFATGENSPISMATAPPPAPSPRLAPRRALVADLIQTLNATDILWIHGSNGLGKSQLARLLSARTNERWEFVALKGCNDSERSTRIRDAITKIAHEDFAGLIIDDFPVPATETVRNWIAAAAQEIAVTSRGKIVVTSEREPLPQVRQAFEPLRITVFGSPYLVQGDVSDIIAVSGGDPSLWATPIFLTCGSGHPLLVDARVVGLASRGWPASDRLEGLATATSLNELTEVRHEVSLRLLSELSTDAHVLLLRLSGILGPFDRTLVSAIANLAPPIPRAAPLFDLLVGPWIELRGEDRFSLSPLLPTAAKNLSNNERNAVHRTVINDLIKRTPFPGDLLTSLVVHVMLARDLEGFAFLTRLVLSNPERRQLAPEIAPLLFMTPGENGLLIPENPHLSVLLRTAQVAVAVNLDNSTMIEPLLERAIEESQRLSDELGVMNRYVLVGLVLANEHADLPPRIWVPLLIQYRSLMNDITVPQELRDVMANTDLGGLRADQFFFLARSNKTKTVAGLVELFTQFDSIEPEWRHELLQAAPTLLKGPPLFIQGAWAAEAVGKALDASQSAESYKALAETAARWGEDDVAIECIRSRAVMLDEYLESSDEALLLLDEADKAYPNNDRLKRSRATVLGHIGRHAEELALLSSLVDNYSTDEPLERIMTLRVAAISAAKIGQFNEAARLFRQTYDVCCEERPVTLGLGVRPGLLADAAVMEMLAGRQEAAVLSLRDALRDLDLERDDEDKSLAYGRMAVDHAIQWAAARIEQRDFPTDLISNPGVCSTLSPKDRPAESTPRQPHQGWYLLARFEALLGGDEGIFKQLEVLERNGEVSVQLAVGLAVTQIEQAVARQDIEQLFLHLPRYVGLAEMLLRARQDPKLAAQPVERIVFEAPSQWTDAQCEFARAAVSSLLGSLLLNGDKDGAHAAAERATQLSGKLANLLSTDLSGHQIAPDFMTFGLSGIERLTSDDQLNAESLFDVSVHIFIWIYNIRASALTVPIHRLLSDHWLELAHHRRALLSNPRVAVPAIEAAANMSPSIGAVAKLVEAAAISSTRRLPEFVIIALKAATRETNPTAGDA